MTVIVPTPLAQVVTVVAGRSVVGKSTLGFPNGVSVAAKSNAATEFGAVATVYVIVNDPPGANVTGLNVTVMLEMLAAHSLDPQSALVHK